MGGVLIGLGALMMVGALFMPAGLGDVANLDMLNLRTNLASIGGFVFVGGWLSLILDRLSARRGQQASPTAIKNDSMNYQDQF